MAIIYQKNKKTGITYAYDSTSVWVPELKQPRPKRRYLGRVDENGNIIPTAHRHGKKPSDADEISKLIDCSPLYNQIDELKNKVQNLETENKSLRHALKTIKKAFPEDL